MSDGVIPLVCDLTKPEQAHQAVATACPDVVYHLAGNSRASGLNPLPDPFESNYLMTQWLLDALTPLEKPVTFFLASSVHVYGNHSQQISEASPACPESPYAFSKYLAELAVKQFSDTHPNLKAIVGRLYSCIGPGQDLGFVLSDFCHRLYHLKGADAIFKTGSLKGIRAFMDARDVAVVMDHLVNRTANLKNFETFNLASDHYHSIDEILKTLFEVSGRNPKLQVQEDSAANPFQGMRIDTAKLKQQITPYFRPIHETIAATWQYFSETQRVHESP